MTTPASGKDELDKILAALAEDLINYDQRMSEAGAPNIRFVHKYTGKAKAALLKWRTAAGQQLLRELMESLPKKEAEYSAFNRTAGFNDAIDQVTALFQHKLDEISWKGGK